MSVPRPVAVFLPDCSGGGAERSLVRIANELALRGHAIDLVLGARSGPLLAEVDDAVRVVDLGRPRLRAAVRPLRAYLRARRPSHLLATLEHAIVVAAAALRGTGGATVLVPRLANTLSQLAPAPPWTPEGVARRLASGVYRRVPVVVAVSRGAADDLVRTVGPPRGRLEVVPNPVVGPDLFAHAARPATHPWFHDGGPPVVTAMGRLTAQKRFARLLRAFAVARADTPMRLVVLGEGEERERLEQLAHELGVGADVSLPGFVDNPFALLSRSAAFVLSSDFEGLPGALIQAVACGAPVVATDCPSGPSEVLDGGRHGRLVALGDDEDALVDALGTAIGQAVRDGHPDGADPTAAWQPYAVPTAVAAYERVLGIASSQAREVVAA